MADFGRWFTTMSNEDPFADYHSFLRSAIQRYWDRKGSSKITFLALMFASRHAWPIAVKKGFSAESGKKALTGAAGVAAATMLIRTFLGGPLGLLLAGASAVSLIAVYGKNQEAIWKKVVRFRGLIDDFEPHYDAIEEQTERGDLNADQRNLMLEGLMARFLDQLDEIPPSEAELEDQNEEDQSTGFAAHVARQEENE